MTTVTPVRVLYLEDSEADAELVQALLDESGMVCTLTRVENPDEFAAALEGGGVDLILSDTALPSYDVLSALAREHRPKVPFIFVSGTAERALDSIAKIAVSFTEYSVVGKANSTLHRAVDVRLDKQKESTQASLARILHTPRNGEPVPHTGNLRYTAPSAPLSRSRRQSAKTCEICGVSEAEWEGVLNCIPGAPRAKKRGRRIHRAQTWAGGLCASLLALAACRAGETTPAPATNATRIPEPSDVAQLKKMSVEELMDIEVTTVARRESTVGQSPAAVHVITQEDIRRSGATTFPELFRRVPGMDGACIDNNKWAVSARGFNERFESKLLLQIDGRSLYNPLNGGVYWDLADYPLEDVERIEIIRGPGASVWGANAVNGIIKALGPACDPSTDMVQ